MKLYEGEIGKTYIVTGVLVDVKLTRRLESLGVNEETPIIILNKKGSGTLIIKVRGTRLALGKRIADGIEIKGVDDDGSKSK
ncbi:MAG: FeoA family protein [Hungatella sp.]